MKINTSCFSSTTPGPSPSLAFCFLQEHPLKS